MHHFSFFISISSKVRVFLFWKFKQRSCESFIFWCYLVAYFGKTNKHLWPTTSFFDRCIEEGEYRQVTRYLCVLHTPSWRFMDMQLALHWNLIVSIFWTIYMAWPTMSLFSLTRWKPCWILASPSLTMTKCLASCSLSSLLLHHFQSPHTYTLLLGCWSPLISPHSLFHSWLPLFQRTDFWHINSHLTWLKLARS